MNSKTLPLLFAVAGFARPVAIAIVDRMSAGGWWPRWVIYVWPTSYMLIANSAVMDATAYATIVFSALLNAVIYARIGLLLYFGIRATASLI